MNDVFISYSRRDKVFTFKLFEALKAQGREIWADWEDIPPASDWFAEIKEGIEQSQSVLFVLSPEWIKSNECRKEMDYAVKMGKRLVPVVWQNVDPKDVPAELAKINWIFMREGDDFDKGFQLVSATLDTDLEWLKSHTRLQTRALEWEKKHRNHSFALRGQDLDDAEQFLSLGSHRDPSPTPLQGEYILISRKEAVRIQRTVLVGVIAALVVSVVLGIVAAFQWQVAQRAEATAVAERDKAIIAQQIAVTAQAAAVSAQGTAVAAKEVAVAALAQSERQRLASEANRVLADPFGNPEVAALLSIKSLEEGYIPQGDTALSASITRLFAEQTYPLGTADTTFYATHGVISPNGATLAFASNTDQVSGKIELYSASSNQIYETIQLDMSVQGIAISPDGKYLAVAESSGVAKLFDIKTGDQLVEYQGHTDWVMCVAFSADGNYLLTGSWDGTARLWEVASGAELMTYPIDGPVRSVALSPDARHVFLGMASGTYRIGTQTGEVENFFWESNVILSLSVAPDGNSFATATDLKATIWDIETEQPYYIQHPDWVYSVAFSPDGQFLVTGSQDRIIRVWLAENGMLVRALVGHLNSINSVAYSPDGSHVLSTSLDGTARLWNADWTKYPRIISDTTGIVTDVAVSPNSDTIVTGNWNLFSPNPNHDHKLWNATTGKLLKTFSGASFNSTSVSFSPNGRYILASNADGAVRIWDATTAELVQFIQVNGNGYTNDAVFSADGQFILAGSDDGTASLWNAETGGNVLTLSHPDRVESVAISPDDKLAATGSYDSVVRLWDLSTGELIRSFEGHTAPTDGYRSIQSVQFSPDGKYILSGSVDGTAILWSVDTGNSVRAFDHGGQVVSVAISPNGKYVLTGSFDRTAKLWDLQTGDLVRAYIGHGDSVYVVTFAPNGQFIVTGSADNTLRIWDVDYRDTIQLACSLLRGREFTANELATYKVADARSVCP